jgi:hypothetical protein
VANARLGVVWRLGSRPVLRLRRSVTIRATGSVTYVPRALTAKRHPQWEFAESPNIVAQLVLLGARVSGPNNRVERRVADRRLTGSEMDVSRLEHENLFRQVDEVLRRIARIELELHHHEARIEALENVSTDLSIRQKRAK